MPASPRGRGDQRCNDFSLGIELEGCDDLPFEDAQYLRLLALLGGLCAAYPIDAVVGHSDISPGRKTDPGPLLRLAAPGCHRRVARRPAADADDRAAM
jgi:N-acetyl-anhydromuramyl-L-alanine amidase AmpD